MKNRMQAPRYIDKQIHATHSFDSVNSFVSQTGIRAGINTIWEGGLPIDFLISPKESDTLVIVLNGAITPEIRLPWLAGGSLTRGLKVSRMFISDPSLYLGQGLTSAYYSGSRYQPDLQSYLVRIIGKIATTLNIRNILFFGGSSGGFASLVLSRSFPGSVALVFNPQTNLLEHLRRPVLKWLSVAWEKEYLCDLPDSVRWNVTSMYEQSFDNRVIYMQNKTDHHHDRHFLPFLRNVGDGDFQYMVHNEAQGHKPPPKGLLRRVLEETLSTDIGERIRGFSAR